MRVRKVFAASFVVFLSLVVASAQTKSAPKRITFARGATVARSTGYLRGVGDEAWFVLRASAGQHTRVEIKGRGATRGVLIFPSGKQDGGPGGVIYDDTIDETGEYKIRVTESSMADAWRGSFSVTVEILPRRESASSSQNLARYVGKYPSEFFRREPSVKTRLRSLLGASYKTFFDRLQVEMPIERDGDSLVARGCMAHSCGVEEAILVIDLADGTPYAALRISGKFRTFATDRSRIPEALERAMKQ